MKIYIMFGDYSGDGHCQNEKILVDAPSMAHILEAQRIVREEYGKDIFEHMATKYEDPHFGKDVWDLLLNTAYPIDRLEEYLDGYNLDGYDSLFEFLIDEPNPDVNIEFVIDAFIWILNCAGAEIVRIDDEETIPTINYRDGFDTVGYGCYD